MQYVGSWATELEIQAVADFIGVSIFTFYDGRWLEYSCRKDRVSNQAIYLESCNGSHYKSVQCVNLPYQNSCYGHCKQDRLSSVPYNLRKQDITGSTDICDVLSVLSPSADAHSPC